MYLESTFLIDKHLECKNLIQKVKELNSNLKGSVT